MKKIKTIYSLCFTACFHSLKNKKNHRKIEGIHGIICLRERTMCMGIISNDANGIEDPQLYEMLLGQFGNGRFGRKLREEALESVRELTIVNTQIEDLSFLRFFSSFGSAGCSCQCVSLLVGFGICTAFAAIKTE